MERVSMTKTAAFVLEKMAQTERFCNAQLFGYINDISKEEQSQFLWYVSGWMIRVSMYLSAEQTIRLWAGARTLTWVICPRHRGS